MQNPKASLHIRCVSREDQALEVQLRFSAQQFSGVASAWFATAQVREFGAALEAFPFMQGTCLRLAGGIWNPTGEELVKEHVAVQVRPEGSAGDIRMQLRVSNFEQDEFCQACGLSASMAVRVGYSEVLELRQALSALLAGSFEEIPVNLYIRSR